MKNDLVQFDIGSYKQTVTKFYNREEYKNNPSAPHIKEYVAHWIIVVCSEKNAIEYFSIKLKDRKLLTKSDPNDPKKPLTLALAILFKKKQVEEYLIRNVFTATHFLPKRFSEYHEAEQYLLRDVFQHSLKNAWCYNGEKEISFSEMSIKEINEKFHINSYQDFVYSKIRTTFLQAYGCQKNQCKVCEESDFPKTFLFQKKKEYEKNPCSIVIKENPLLKEKKIENSLGVYSKGKTEKYSFIGEYTGEYLPNEGSKFDERHYYKRFLPQSANYSFNEVDGERLRNFTAVVNWGFPNIISSSICEEYKRTVFISIDEIQSGKEFLLHYGTSMFPALYALPFILLNKEEMLEHFSKGFNFRYNELAQLIDLETSEKSIPGLCGKICYLVHVPAAYIYMHAKGLFNIVNFYQKKNFLLEELKGYPIAFRLSSLVKNFFEIFEKSLAKESALKQKIYDFIIEYIEEISIIQLLHILERMHVLIKKNELGVQRNFEETKNELLKDIKGYKWEQDKDHPLSLDKYFEK